MRASAVKAIAIAALPATSKFAALSARVDLPAARRTGTSLALDQSLEWFGTARLRGGVLVSPRAALRHRRSGLWRDQDQRYA